MEQTEQGGSFGKKMADPETDKRLTSLLERVQVLEEAQIAGKAFSDLQTNSMVERLAESLEKATILLDRLTRPDTLLLMERLEKISPAMLRLMDVLETAEKTGAFQSFAEIGGAVRAVQLMGVDTLVERVAVQAEKATEILGKIERLPVEDMVVAVNRLKELGALDTIPELASVLVAIRRLLTDSLVERVMLLIETAISWQGNVYNVLKSIPAPPAESPGGIMGTIRLLSNPETQKTLSFFLSGLKQVELAMKP